VRRFLAWRGLDEWRAESCTVERSPDGIHASGAQIAPAYHADYRLELDSGFITRALTLRVRAEAGEGSLVLRRSGGGSWTANDRPLPHVEGALDCDLAFSPLTNFMPAKRLRGEAVDHVMAWVSLPDLEVTRSEQRYEPLGPGRVRYVGLEDGFTAELELDADGFVTHYPGLAARAPAASAR
jgi:hypothetical protein